MVVEGAPPQQASSVTVHLPDLEPVGGLIAACARLSLALPPELIDALPESAADALTTIQSILWRLEHSRPESPGG